jgi:antitoxin VapB
MTLIMPWMEVGAMQSASVITCGESQSVELPKGFQIDGAEVFVKRLGSSILLLPTNADPWDLMAGSLDQFTNDFMNDRAQPSQQQREGLFE